MLIVGGCESCHLGRDASFFFSHLVDGAAIIGAKSFMEVRDTIKHSVAQLVWLDEAMSVTFDPMLEQLEAYMQATPVSSDSEALLRDLGAGYLDEVTSWTIDEVVALA